MTIFGIERMNKIQLDSRIVFPPFIYLYFSFSLSFPFFFLLSDILMWEWCCEIKVPGAQYWWVHAPYSMSWAVILIYNLDSDIIYVIINHFFSYLFYHKFKLLLKLFTSNLKDSSYCKSLINRQQTVTIRDSY